jgi:hypothetical protein
MRRRGCFRDGIRTLIIALLLTASAFAEEGRVVKVSNVEELYAAVNNPAYAGAIVVLAPATYTLTVNDANDQPRPNAGRLVLQSGMALIGQNRYVDFDGDGIWDPRDDNKDGVRDTDPVRGLIFADPATETIIDAVNLSGGPGALVVGLDNRVEKLTVRNTTRINAGIDLNVDPPMGGMSAEIRDCIAEDGRRGIRMLMARIGQIGNSSAVLERNILRRNTSTFNGAGGFGAQITIQVISTSSWDVIVRNNLSYANRWGLFVAGEGASDSQFHVLSMGNLYRENELGVRIDDGRNGGSGNHTQFTSINDRIVDNVRPSGGDLLRGGGVLAIAGLNTDAIAPVSSNNSLNLQFFGTRWGGNFYGPKRQDLQVYGYLALDSRRGTNDTAKVLIRRATSDGSPEAFQFIGSQPSDPTKTDAVNIIAVDVRFIRTNVENEPVNLMDNQRNDRGLPLDGAYPQQ